MSRCSELNVKILQPEQNLASRGEEVNEAIGHRQSHCTTLEERSQMLSRCVGYFQSSLGLDMVAFNYLTLHVIALLLASLCWKSTLCMK
jgi:hypothetical protein